MRIKKTKLPDTYIIKPEAFADERGWFCETFREEWLKKLGFQAKFVQENHSKSYKKGTLRGLHLQKKPLEQAKLIRCTRGAVLDVVVDLRKKSPTYKKWQKLVLSEENKKQVLIPKGFAHGFLTLKANSEIQYKVDRYYSREADRSIRYNDKELNINWGVKKPTLSSKDAKAPYLKDCDL